MRNNFTFNQFVVALLLLVMSTPIWAISAVATVNVKVNRFLSLANTNAMNFGEISVNSVAGAVTVKADGSRESSGGVVYDSKGSFSPAKFVIEGAQGADYSISFPEEVVMTDGSGNTMIVDQINGELLGETENDSNGLRELVVGARLNLEAFQATGDYSGSLLVEVEYQ